MKNEFTKPLSRFYSSDKPDLNASSEDIVLVASVEDMAKTLPSHDARKRIIATDALGSVDGFRIMVQMTFSHLWGMCVCQNCHDCNNSAEPCQDMFGSNATSEGGIVGRVDAVYTSIEAQKSTGNCMLILKLLFNCCINTFVCRRYCKKLRKQLENIIQ